VDESAPTVRRSQRLRGRVTSAPAAPLRRSKRIAARNASAAAEAASQEPAIVTFGERVNIGNANPARINTLPRDVTEQYIQHYLDKSAEANERANYWVSESEKWLQKAINYGYEPADGVYHFSNL
jgi:hypothetical protein